jgi:hypothetical protein
MSLREVLHSTDTAEQLDPMALSGVVDIRARVGDAQSFTGWLTGSYSVLRGPLQPTKVVVELVPAGATAPLLQRDVYAGVALDDVSLVDTSGVPFANHFAPGTWQTDKVGICLTSQPLDCRGHYWVRLFAAKTATGLDTTSVPDGAYVLRVTAYDEKDNTAVREQTIRITNHGRGDPLISGDLPSDMRPDERR